jgi:hypothetical protein
VCSRAGRGVAEYRVVFARSAHRELEGLDATVARRIILRIEALTTDPRPQGVSSRRALADLWRPRIGNFASEKSDAGGAATDGGQVR